VPSSSIPIKRQEPATSTARINDIGVQQLFPAEGRVDAANLDMQIESAPPYISWAATGGRRIKTSELLAVRTSVLKIASSLGFPRISTQAQRAEFDAQCSAYLLQSGVIPAGEALRDDVWAYVATVLLPDVCLWRFATPPKERFFGGVRNTFQRLWLRARAFDRGPDHPKRWELLSQLSEDAKVQITERPSVAADPRLALMIAECWLKTANKAGKSRMEDTTRSAVRNLRIANEVLYFAALDEKTIESATQEYFDIAARPSA
jgi:hypothetical protein